MLSSGSNIPTQRIGARVRDKKNSESLSVGASGSNIPTQRIGARVRDKKNSESLSVEQRE